MTTEKKYPRQADLTIFASGLSFSISNLFAKGFPFYGVMLTYADLCRFCTFLNSANLASWAKFKNMQNLHKSMWRHRKETLWQNFTLKYGHFVNTVNIKQKSLIDNWEKHFFLIKWEIESFFLKFEAIANSVHPNYQ